MTAHHGRNGPWSSMQLLSVESSCVYVLWSGSLILCTVAEVALPEEKVCLDIKESPKDLLMTTSEKR